MMNLIAAELDPLEYEEAGSGALPSYVATDPELFAADALIIVDAGSISPGIPTLATSLRGLANVTIEVHTLQSGKHSGEYGGAAPDALLAVIHAIATLHDEHGDVGKGQCVAASRAGCLQGAVRSAD